jgi:superfamily II DNA or RNA helicase
MTSLGLAPAPAMKIIILKRNRMEEPLKPYPYQQRDIDQIANNGGTGVIATQVGGGKTLVAIEVAKHIGAECVLVIAPKGTHRRAWHKTILRQIPDAEVKYINSSPQGHQAMAGIENSESGWYLISPEFFRTMTWIGITPDLAVFDEIHRASNRDSKTAKMLLTLKAKQRIGMSGTIAGNRIEGFWSVLRWIYPDIAGRSFWRWVNTYCLTKPDYFAGQIVVGEKKSGEIAKSIPCYIRHLKREECCEFHPDGMDADLPSLVSIERTVQLSPEQRRIYRKMEKDLLVWLGEHPLTAEIPVATRIRLRQITLGTPSISPDDVVYFADDCKSSKIDELFNIIEDHPDGDAMLVLTHSQKFAKVVVARLAKAGFTAFEWSGQAPQKERDKALEDFIAGDIQFIVGVIAAIGEGTDGLQERCSTMVWLSKDDNRLLNEQAMGRLDRRGQTRAVVSYEIIAEDTYDEGQLSKLLVDQMNMNRSLRRDADEEIAPQAQATYNRLGVNEFLDVFDE